ncbi:MAG TPA: LCP family protein [Solirubrobacteraceae bacterium]|nr:LCP family protein [Solirubrobacteraceae bacterium]
MPPEPPQRRWWLVWRFLAAAVGVVLISGGATYAIARNEVSRLVEALKQHPPVKVAPHVLAPTYQGAPETLLLVGNDERRRTTTSPVLPHSNEMLLVRIDPGQPTISMLSIPRELKVPIDKPDGEIEENRINAAYQFGWENGGGTAGGVKLMVETIKQVLGLEVNHVFVTNFSQFAKAVNAMGCVYLTVDKHYEHTNEPGGEQYFEVHLKPGYQKLCGEEALEFVAARHESTSLIRDARDQRFLLETKAEYGSSLVSEREKFEDIFGKYVENTLENEEQVLQLIYLLIESAGKPVRQVQFNVTLEKEFDSATPEQIHEAVGSFLNGTAAISGVNLSAHPAAHAHTHHSAAPSGLGFALTPTTGEELAEARAQAPNLPFPLEYPRVRDSYAGAEPDELRLYRIHDLHGRTHPIYCVVISRGEVGQYYDVQGTTWTDPPVLSHPGQTVHLGSRTYELSYVGEHVKTIAWREDGAVYWIENTLTNNVSPHVMLAMAQQTIPVISTRATHAVRTAAVAPANIDLAPRASAPASTTAKIEALLGFVGLGIVGLLLLFALVRQRELRRLREAVAHALALDTHQRPLLVAAGLSYDAPLLAPGTSPAIAGAASAEQPPTIYRAARDWRRVALAGVLAVALAAAIAVGVYLLQGGSSTPSASVHTPVAGAPHNPPGG